MSRDRDRSDRSDRSDRGDNKQQQTSQEIKQGPVEIDYEAIALIVNYTLEKCVVDPVNGRVLEVLGRTNKVQRVKLHMLTPDKNMAKLADEIVRNCNKIIHPSRTEEIEQLLLKLQKHVVTNAGKEEKGGSGGGGAGGDKSDGRAEGKSSKKNREEKQQLASSSSKQQPLSPEDDYRISPPAPLQLPPARMDQLDDYLELLYQVPNSGSNNSKAEEGMRDQIRGTAMLLQLCRDDVMHLEQLIQNSTVMGALTRVLQEEYKKNIELTFNILRIFLSFSNFVEMHDLMSSYRIGLLTMKSIEFEIARTEHRDAELAEKLARINAELKACRRNEDGLDESELNKKVQGLRRQRDKEEYFHGLLSKKQDKLLFVSLYILLNLAEEPTVEKKMVKKDLIGHLNFMLSRRNADLLVISVTMLRKLSIIGENKDAMRSLGVVPKLVRFIPCSSQALVNNILRLLFNLSFDKECRNQMIRAGLLPKLIKLLATQACFRGRSLKLLYHLSADDTCKSMFSVSNSGSGSGMGSNMSRNEMIRGSDEVGGIVLLLGMIVNFPQDQLPKELAALAVNLTYNKTNCQLMIQNKAVSKMVERYMNARTKDSLLVKIIRNLSLFTFNFQQEQEKSGANLDYQYRGLWSPHIKNIVLMLTDCDNHDVLVEILGTMANLTLADLPTSQPWSKFIKEYNLISLLSKLLIPGMSQNDVILEVVMLVSAMLSDPEACALIVATNIVQLLLSMWREKGKHDLEILLQLIYCIYRLLSQETSRDEVLYGNRVVVTYLIEALDHSSNHVRRIADQCLELVVELDRKSGQSSASASTSASTGGSLSSLIKKKRFESYNSGWLAAMNSLEHEEGLMGGGGYGAGYGSAAGQHDLDYAGLDPDTADEMMMGHGGYGSGMGQDQDIAYYMDGQDSPLIEGDGRDGRRRQQQQHHYHQQQHQRAFSNEREREQHQVSSRHRDDDDDDDDDQSESGEHHHHHYDNDAESYAGMVGGGGRRGYEHQDEDVDRDSELSFNMGHDNRQQYK